MIILEDTGVKQDSIKKILNTVKKNFNEKNYKFDFESDGYLVWCSGDNDKTVFIQSKDETCYAAVFKQEIDNESESDILESIKYQLDNTFEEDEDFSDGESTD